VKRDKLTKKKTPHQKERKKKRGSGWCWCC